MAGKQHKTRFVNTCVEQCKKTEECCFEGFKRHNRIIEKIGEKESKVVFGKVAKKEGLCVIGISDASYHQENPTIAGSIIMLGNIKKQRKQHQYIGRVEL